MTELSSAIGFVVLVTLYSLPAIFNVPQPAITQAMVVVVGLMLALED